MSKFCSRYKIKPLNIYGGDNLIKSEDKYLQTMLKYNKASLHVADAFFLLFLIIQTPENAGLFAVRKGLSKKRVATCNC